MRDFLFTQPVRRRLLAADARGEAERVRAALFALALIRPDVAFTLRSGAATLLSLPAGRSLASTFADAHGGSALAPLSLADQAAGLSLAGGACAPDSCAPDAFYLFANGALLTRSGFPTPDAAQGGP